MFLNNVIPIFIPVIYSIMYTIFTPVSDILLGLNGALFKRKITSGPGISYFVSFAIVFIILKKAIS